MTVFEKIFVSLLDKDLINSATTWNTGMQQYYLSVFPKKKNFDKPTARHMQPVVRDPGFRKHPQLVPTYQKAKNKIHKVEAAKTGARQVLSQNEIEDVRKRYNLSALHPSAPKKLGNTGVMIKFDPQLRGYILHK